MFVECCDGIMAEKSIVCVTVSAERLGHTLCMERKLIQRGRQGVSAVA